jgi:cytochrome c oxidase subunit IV
MSHSIEKNPNVYVPETYVPHVESHGTSGIWKTFWILLALTIIDVVFYFTFPPEMWRNIIFIILGIVKAYFIIGDFMHMKHEKSDLVAVILVPVVFIFALIMGLMQEGYMLSTY